MSSNEWTQRTRCPVCRGTGIDPALHRRYTTGGRDDRNCRECHGECYVEFEDINQVDNSATEMEWVNAWSDLLELIGDRREVTCVLPDWTAVSVEECKAWLQDSAYAGFTLSVSETWYQGRKAIAVQRIRK